MIKLFFFICLSTLTFMLAACHKKSVDKAVNPLDTIPSKPHELSGNEAGYCKVLYSDGSLRLLGFMCDGLREGAAYFFDENGLIAYYVEYEQDRMDLKITYESDGVPLDCSQGGVIWVNGVDSFPPDIQERIDFVAANCPNNSAINWNAILTDDCN